MFNHEHYNDPTAGAALRKWCTVSIEPRRCDAFSRQRKKKQAEKLAHQNLELQQRALAITKYGGKLAEISNFLTGAYVGNVDNIVLDELRRLEGDVGEALRKYVALLNGIATENTVTLA